MINFSINLGSKRLEALIMTTRTELTAQINALAETVSTEAAQVQANVKALADVVEMLKAQVAAFEAAGVELDFSAESAALAAVSASIASIVDPA